MKEQISVFIIVFLFLNSCKTPKDITYFQGIDSLSPEQVAEMDHTYTSLISINDLLTITVTAWDPTVVTPFNPPVYSYAVPGEITTYSPQQLKTYLVEEDGYINFPVLGKVKAAGITRNEFAENLRRKISTYVKDAIVNVQIVNYTVTIMGEVIRPGVVSVRNDRISILEALGQAGDLTIYGNRKNVLIVRDNNGAKEIGRIDMTSPTLFSSPYYYLRQNDMVYVEPNKAKKKNADFSQARQYNVTVFSSIMSTLNVITNVIRAVQVATDDDKSQKEEKPKGDE